MLRNLIQNEYTELYKENRLRSSTLNKRNQDILRQVHARMMSYTWNCYEIELVRKDLIGMAARAEAQDHDLEQVMGCDSDEYCRQIVDDIDRGSPLDYLSTWYPAFYLLYAVFNVIALVISGGTADASLVRELMSPFLFLLWLYLCAWLHRIGHRLCLRFGMWVEMGWNILLLALFMWLCIYSGKLLSSFPVTMPLWLAILYQLAWAVGSQLWQNTRYNRYAQDHPWREQPRT